ncbi:helix-turn-helix domain-containing protein [Nonomuraea sp. NPDC049158]|uniref:helix-turn-helix domain-containing protein n=1 Tax=Nonomuraea sp. NPDC049158 TaxID=3155649 RepID=UPI0033EC2B43
MKGYVESARYWRYHGLGGLDLMRAQFAQHRFARHSHETYAMGTLEAGATMPDPPGLTELAATAGVTPYALLRSFRQAYGMPPHAYVTQLRVAKARELLRQGMPPTRPTPGTCRTSARWTTCPTSATSGWS